MPHEPSFSECVRNARLMFEMARLSLPAPEFATMTYPRYRNALTAGSDEFEAIGATRDGVPVGLVLLRHRSASAGVSNPDTVIVSVFVDRAWRRQGAASELLARAEQRARSAGSCRVLGHYASGNKSRAAVEALLARRGWSSPALLEFRLGTRPDWTERVAERWDPFMARIRREGFAATVFTDISEADQDAAQAVIDQGLPHPSLDYRIFAPHCDPAISVALRRHGELVGWVLGESNEPGLHHYTSGHVRPDLQRRSWLIAGIHAVSRLQCAAYGPDSVGVFETFGTNAPMVAFMQRRLGPTALWVDERFESIKALVAETAA